MNYSALDRRPSAKEPKSYIWSGAMPTNIMLAYVIWFVLFAGFGLVGIISGGSGGALVWSVFIVFFLSLGILGLYQHAARRWRLDTFASENGLEVRHDVANTGYASLIFQQGDTRRIRHELIEGVRGISLGLYEYVSGSGKNRHTYSYTYVRVPLRRAVPHLVIDAKANNILGSSGLLSSIDQSQRLLLEGNFNDYSTVYCPKQYERDALYILTPELMELLVIRGRDFDCEMKEKEVCFFVASDRLNSKESLMTLFMLADTIGAEVVENTQRYTDERSSVNGAVAAQGSSLKQSLPIWVVMVFVFICIFVIIFS